MDDESEQDSELLSRGDWDETTESLEAAVQDIGKSPKRQAPFGDRRSSGHLWLVSYSDLMTILMIFFLALYGYTVLAKAKIAGTQEKQVSYSDFAEIVGKLKGSLGEGLEIEEGKGSVTLRLSDKILFSSGQANLNVNAKRSLAEIAASLKLVEGDIVVEGHTDNVPIHGGRYQSNWELSAARAFSVIEALTQDGVPAERMAAWGFGENRPRESNVEEVGRGKNRRIEIVVNKKEPSSNVR